MATQTAGWVGSQPRVRASARRWRRLREVGLGYGLLAPAFFLLIVFEFYPVAYGFYISVRTWKLSCTQFIGLDNYMRAFSDPEMWTSLGTTVTYAAISVPLQLILRPLYRVPPLSESTRTGTYSASCSSFPYITSTVASTAIWAYLYSPDLGG